MKLVGRLFIIPLLAVIIIGGSEAVYQEVSSIAPISILPRISDNEKL